MGVRDLWNGPMCWLDGDRLALWGYGSDEQRQLVDGVVIVDARTGLQERWFAGPPCGELAHDGPLFALAREHVSAWDVATGARVLASSFPGHAAPRYHPDTKSFATSPRDGYLAIGRLVGGAAAATWNTGAIRSAAQAIRRARDFEALPVLGDALEAAGCDDAELLAHCRAPGSHGASCWAVDRLLTAEEP
jgi:hypothetical protein